MSSQNKLNPAEIRELDALCQRAPEQVLSILFERLEPPEVHGLDAGVFFENLLQNLLFVAEDDVAIRISSDIHKLRLMAKNGLDGAQAALDNMENSLYYFSSPEWLELHHLTGNAKVAGIEDYFRKCARQAEMVDAVSDENLSLAEFFTIVKAAMMGNDTLGIPNYSQYRQLALDAFKKQSEIFAHQIIDEFEPNKMLAPEEQVLLRAAACALARQHASAMEGYFCQIEHAIDALASGQGVDQALSTALNHTVGMDVGRVMKKIAQMPLEPIRSRVVRVEEVEPASKTEPKAEEAVDAPIPESYRAQVRDLLDGLKRPEKHPGNGSDKATGSSGNSLS